VALPYRSALFFRVPDDLATPTVSLLKTIVHSGGTRPDLGRRGSSICGSIIVEVPFLLRLGNLARMQVLRQLYIVCPTFAIVIASVAILFFRRRNIPPTRACLAGLNAAYLANAAFCLTVYGPIPGTAGSRSGWIVTMVIVWPMLLELVWIFIQSFRRAAMAKSSSVV
jgi:hypothetical protein